MKWLYSRLYRKDKGFTLIELLIVIIILAVLAGIAIPSYLTITTRAKKSATQAELSSIAVAIEMYNADNNKYPPVGTFALLIPILQGTDTTNNPTSTVYMKKVPIKDKWTVDYTYNGTGGVTYTMTSTGGGTGNTVTFTDGQMTSS